MRRLAFALALATALPTPTVAQSPQPAPVPSPQEEWSPPLADDPQETQPESGMDLIERGLGTLFENLLRDVQPQMEEMARGLDDTFNRFAPVFDDLGSLIDDIGNYQTPERLPNGDILIRRLPDAPPPPPINSLRDLTRPSPDAPGDDVPAPRVPTVPSGPGAPLEL